MEGQKVCGKVIQEYIVHLVILGPSMDGTYVYGHLQWPMYSREMCGKVIQEYIVCLAILGSSMDGMYIRIYDHP